MPTISTYITTYNALFYQSTLEQTIRHALMFSDEVVIANSENSTDGTLALLHSLKSEYPNKIKILQYREDYTKNILADRRNFALKHCKGDYCILQDDDEVIHEDYVVYIKSFPYMCPDAIAFRFNTIHFYRSYDYHQPDEGDWYSKKIYMIKNLPNIKHGSIDGVDPDNFIIELPDYYEPDYPGHIIPLDDFGQPSKIVDTPITCHHYGWTRHDAILLLKKYHQEIDWHGKDYWKTHEFPFKFDNPTDLPRFTGTHPKYMIPLIIEKEKLNSRHIKDFTKTLMK